VARRLIQTRLAAAAFFLLNNTGIMKLERQSKKTVKNSTKIKYYAGYHETRISGARDRREDEALVKIFLLSAAGTKRACISPPKKGFSEP
jgi:hypothetical protein